MIADVFKGQWTDEVKSLIEKGTILVTVSHNMMNFFEPLNLKVHRSRKSFLRDIARIWYAEQVQAQISKGIASESVSVDLKISILKLIHAKWVTQYYDHIHTDEDIVKNG